jgi:hypothetical protein
MTSIASINPVLRVNTRRLACLRSKLAATEEDCWEDTLSRALARKTYEIKPNDLSQSAQKININIAKHGPADIP